jgi:hypothetical protein
MVRTFAGIAVLMVCALAQAFQADLVPLRMSPATEDMDGAVSITGEDGHVRVLVESVNDDKGNPLDGTATLQLHLKIDGRGRRFSLPVALDTGDGQSEASLNLAPGARIVVRSIRLRGPTGRTLAIAGMVIQPEVPTTTTTTLPVTPDNCPANLTSCQAALTGVQADLDDCNEELDACELGE